MKNKTPHIIPFEVLHVDALSLYEAKHAKPVAWLREGLTYERLQLALAFVVGTVISFATLLA